MTEKEPFIIRPSRPAVQRLKDELIQATAGRARLQRALAKPQPSDCSVDDVAFARWMLLFRRDMEMLSTNESEVFLASARRAFASGGSDEWLNLLAGISARRRALEVLDRENLERERRAA